ncbi:MULTISPECIES: hypothetical protein [Shewanella]|nr:MULTISPECIES: hypothetical protein [Shewanella]
MYSYKIRVHNLAGQAIDNHGGTSFKHTPQYQLSQKLNQKM